MYMYGRFFRAGLYAGTFAGSMAAALYMFSGSSPALPLPVIPICVDSDKYASNLTRTCVAGIAAGKLLSFYFG